MQPYLTHRDLTLDESLDPAAFGAARERMIAHPVFASLDDLENLRTFMEAHVFAVWDFMSLVKRLQRDLTCVKVPWLPRADTQAAQLVNRIVLGEETDIGPGGEPISHLELYLAAMREVGANTTRFEMFRCALAGGADLPAAFGHAGVAAFIREFTGHTLRVAKHAPILAVMAHFLYGREDAIPLMFNNLLTNWGLDAAQAPMFAYYLNRHIDLDGHEHGPAAEAILRRAIERDPTQLQIVIAAARESITARVRFWDGVLACMPVSRAG